MVTTADFRDAQARRMTEKALQNKIGQMASDLVKMGRVLYYHTHRSEHSPAGLPDCLFVNRRRTGADGFLFIELKRECSCRPDRARCPYHPSPEQQVWLDWLAAVGVEVHVLRPSDYYSGRMGQIVTAFAAAGRSER